MEEPAWLTEKFASGDDTSAVISKAALARKPRSASRHLICLCRFTAPKRAIWLCAAKSLRGLYIGGGIAPKILDKLKDGTFMRAFLDKGRYTDLLAAMPVQVILNDKAAPARRRLLCGVSSRWLIAKSSFAATLLRSRKERRSNGSCSPGRRSPASGRFTRRAVRRLDAESALFVIGFAEYRGRVDWRQVHLFWGDERCVPPDHPESNYRMVREALLEQDRHSAGEHPSHGRRKRSRSAAAAEYEQELRQFFSQTKDAAPRFDLVLLGLGEDGHTASLFPGTSAPNETHKLVATVYVERLNAHRLTITLPVINAAAQVSFLVAGEGKSAIVKALLGQDSNPAQYPAGQVRPANGRLTWFITQDAAGGIVTSL